MSSQPLSFEPPRGMRDFYPEEMALRNRVFDAWKRAAALSGFAPYDACVVESLELSILLRCIYCTKTCRRGQPLLALQSGPLLALH